MERIYQNVGALSQGQMHLYISLHNNLLNMNLQIWKNLPELSYFYSYNPILELYKIKIDIENELLNQILINSKLQEKIHEQIQQNSEKQKSSTIVQTNQDQYIGRNIESSYLIPPIAKVSCIPKKQLVKNESKNIPKNFGKAIITFAEQNPKTILRCLTDSDVSYQQLIGSLKQKKKEINSIANLRNLWLDSEYTYAKEMRKISQYFLKRGALEYIFKSRISNHKGHIKYRKRIIEVLQHPEDFTYVKSV